MVICRGQSPPTTPLRPWIPTDQFLLSPVIKFLYSRWSEDPVSFPQLDGKLWEDRNSILHIDPAITLLYVEQDWLQREESQKIPEWVWSVSQLQPFSLNSAAPHSCFSNMTLHLPPREMQVSPSYSHWGVELMELLEVHLLGGTHLRGAMVGDRGAPLAFFGAMFGLNSTSTTFFFSLDSFPTVLLRYNLHTTLYEFKVYGMMIWLTYTVKWYHNKFN